MDNMINNIKTYEQFNMNTYKELEFICYNSCYDDSTDKKNQHDLYNDLKQLQIDTNYSILPYMQDFSDDEHTELSLAVVILDKSQETELENLILDIADNNDVKFDLYNEIPITTVNGIIRGDYYNNII